MRVTTMVVLLAMLAGCNGDSKKEETTDEDVKEFMKDVFDEDWGEEARCDALIGDAKISGLCIARQSDFKINKDVENPLVCIYVLTSEKSTVDIAINKSPMALLTGTIYAAAKSDAEKKGKVYELKGLGKKAFYTENEYKASDYKIKNKDLVFYKDKAVYTLHTVSGSSGNRNCMSDRNQLEKLAKALLDAADN